MSKANLNFDKTNEELLAFLDHSPSAFHAAANMCGMLKEAGYTRLYEGEKWNLEAGCGYYVTRNDSALIAFSIPKKDFTGFQIMASHSDSPVFKIKANAEIEVENQYVKLNVDRDLMIIPNLAIHMNRQVNDGYAFNPQKDMLPLFCEAAEKQVKGCFLELIAKEAGVKAEDILDTDLFLYNRMTGSLLGADGEFLASPHLDDLQCAFSSLKGFLAAEPKDSVAVHCVYDNEEVGSGTKQGAESTFLKDVLHRINTGMGRTEEEYLTALASSFMVSADNAHAIHPNQPDKADPTNRPYLNQGIVIKYSANQKYCTDAVSAAVFKTICEKAEVPYQVFLNRSDILGGSTLGNISGTQVALNTVDIGLPQLAMHSSYETAGSRDTAYLIEAARVLFSGSFAGKGDGNYTIA